MLVHGFSNNDSETSVEKFDLKISNPLTRQNDIGILYVDRNKPNNYCLSLVISIC